jgi:hypothetical protein
VTLTYRPSAQVIAAVERVLPGEVVVELEPRGRWLRDIYLLRTATGLEAVLKLDPDTESGMSAKEAYVAALLQSHGLPVPETLALDADGVHLDVPFIIQRRVGGRRLLDLVGDADEAQRSAIYSSLGRYYRRLHAISAPRSGWIDATGAVLPFSPNEFQQQKVIVDVGARLVAQGLLEVRLHRRLVQLMADSLPFLADHRPTLVRGALPWTVYLDPARGFAVTKETDLHDYLWWDPAWDLASLRYPAFLDIDDACWTAFVGEYGEIGDERRIQLYRLLQLVDASAGNYYEPAAPAHDRWRSTAISLLNSERLGAFLPRDHQGESKNHPANDTDDDHLDEQPEEQTQDAADSQVADGVAQGGPTLHPRQRPEQ